MKTPGSSRRWQRLGAMFLLLVLPAGPAFARVLHSEGWARDRFGTAERAREELSGRPAGERTRRDYQRVIDAYRRVYFGSPSSSKADDSAFAVAELQVEMGRQFRDEKVLRAAVDQYKFLRHEYPGSRHRFAALYSMGDIYRFDLDDAAAARNTFGDFVRRYPHHRLTDDARAAMAGLEKNTRAETAKASRDPDKKEEKKEEKADAAVPAVTSRPDQAEDDAPKGGDAGPSGEATKITQVNGLRHSSSDRYARVSIDLEQAVKFDSGRLPDPDRIFFDLRNTKLAAAVAGKTFDVGDGLLKRVRIGQYRPGRTRVVLEVGGDARYDAYLLANPARLIIDVHGAAYSKNDAMKDAGGEEAKPRAAAQNDVKKPLERVAAAAEKTAPKKTVVEADDADSDEAGGTARAEAQPSPKKPRTVRTSNQPDDARRARHAVRTLGKRKSPDGNDDEVATLEPPDLAGGEKSAGTPKPAVGRARMKPGTGRHSTSADPDPVVHEAVPTASGDRSLTRALGLKIGRIVIDPGHGGHDTGTIGPNHVLEKDVVLDVARRLGKLLEVRLGADVLFTREDDRFIPLEARTAIANEEKADLFVSIHANSSTDPDARGVETYYLNFTSNRDALEVAARENAVSEKSIHELQDLVKKIALKEKIDESREFATEVQRSLHNGLAVKNPGIRDRGVKQAPFVVLIGANMPSILAEISFVSNPTDARKLQSGEYKQRIAEALYKGISRYVGGLSGVKVASRVTKSDAP